MLTIMGIAAETHGIDLVGTKIGIEKLMIADPMRRIGEVIVHIHFPIYSSYTEKEKLILEKAAKTCPVYLSLHERTIKTIYFHWS
jgi:hypothetical protein